MAEMAAHLTDEVIPQLPTRQWVLSVPERLRPFLHQTPEVASAVLGIFLRALRSALRDASPGAPTAVRDAELGAISFPQRFGSSLNPHYHYHILALDGVVSGDVERGVRFHEATRLDVRDAEALARTVQLRVLWWFARRGLLDSTTAADMRTWRGTAGLASHLRCSVSSTAVDGSVRMEGEHRAGIERLVRYCARGPLALERLHAPADIGILSSPEARLVYRLPEPDVHGRQALRLTPLEFLDRLARLVPPPRIHRYPFARYPRAPNRPRSLYTFRLIAPSRRPSANPKASRRSSFGPLLSLTAATIAFSAWGESTSYSHSDSVPSSRQMCRGFGICPTASIRHRAFVSTTWLPIRFPLGGMTLSVQLDACSSSPIYLSMGSLLLGWVLLGSRTSQIVPPYGRSPTA